jgi:hypothetical protein
MYCASPTVALLPSAIVSLPCLVVAPFPQWSAQVSLGLTDSCMVSGPFVVHGLFIALMMGAVHTSGVLVCSSETVWCCAVKWVPCHHGMVHSHILDRGDGLQMWRVAAKCIE